MRDKASGIGEETHIDDEFSVGVDRQFEGAFLQWLRDSGIRFLSRGRSCKLPGLRRIQQVHCLFHRIIYKQTRAP